MAKAKIQLLTNNITICTDDIVEVRQNLRDPKILDFEDGLEYYSAINSGCEIIVLENKKDFYFSDILVFNSKELPEYVLNK